MQKNKIKGFLLILLILSIIAYSYDNFFKTGQSISNLQQNETAILLRVIDGDTIETSQGTIRLLGINTPEKTMPYSNSAKEFLNLFLQKNLTLIKDREDLDKYKRKLRYIFFESRFLNLEILESGWGKNPINHAPAVLI